MNHLGTKTIETKRLILRKFTTDDEMDMYKNWASDDMAYYSTLKNDWN